jgi:hypothetical protein
MDAVESHGSVEEEREKRFFFREAGVGGEESESYTMGGCEHLRRRQEKLLRRTMTRREIEFYIFGSDQRASAPELSALRSVQENCRKPRPLTGRSFNASDDSSARVLLLPAVIGIDEVALRLDRSIGDECTGRLRHSAGHGEHWHQRSL